MHPKTAPTRAAADAGVSEVSKPSRGSATAQRWLLRGMVLLAAAVGLHYGYDIGHRVSGIGLGVVMALNTAVIASIMAGALTRRLCQGWAGSQEPD